MKTMDRVEASVSMAKEKNGPKYKEKDWTNSDLRVVQIYEEECTGGVDEDRVG